MIRSQIKDSLQSPSITPSSFTMNKTNLNKKKPPVHSKYKPNDITNQLKNYQNGKAPTPKKKSNKSRTNSITPKILKHNKYEKMFHNCNLSETDVSAKYLDNRSHSKINKSLINRLELTQKVKELKKNTSPFIDQIIKKSLNKAKQRKLSQEKENKELELEKEIKKQEMLLNNKQIRLQNSLKFKKKKNRSKSRWDSRNATASNTAKLRSESSSKVRNYTGSLFIEPDTKNKRSVSIGDYYMQGSQRKSDPYVLEYIDYKNHKRKEQNQFENLRKKAEEVSKASRLKNLDNFTRHQNIKSSKESPQSIEALSFNFDEEKNEEIYVKRNISFIEDRNSEESLDKEPFDYDFNMLDNERKTKSEYDEDNESINNDRNHLIGQYSDRENPEDIKIKSACIIQKYFRGYLIRKYLQSSRKNLEIEKLQAVQIFPLNNQANNLRIESFETIKFKPIHTEKKRLLSLESNQKILINPIKKYHLSINPLIKDKINIEKVKKNTLSISNELKISIFSKSSAKDKGTKDLNSQLQEQIA